MKIFRNGSSPGAALKVSFAALDGRWTLRFQGYRPQPGELVDVPKRDGTVCRKVVRAVVYDTGSTVYCSFDPDCGRSPRTRKTQEKKHFA